MPRFSHSTVLTGITFATLLATGCDGGSDKSKLAEVPVDFGPFSALAEKAVRRVFFLNELTTLPTMCWGTPIESNEGSRLIARNLVWQSDSTCDLATGFSEFEGVIIEQPFINTDPLFVFPGGSDYTARKVAARSHPPTRFFLGQYPSIIRALEVSTIKPLAAPPARPDRIHTSASVPLCPRSATPALTLAQWASSGGPVKHR